MIYLYYADNTTLWEPETETKLLGQLPGDIAGKIMKYKRPADRQSRIIGKLLLKNALEKLGFSLKLSDLTYNSFGKPIFESGPYFNLSHSETLVICGISPHNKVGVDTEDVCEVDYEMYKSYLSSETLHKIKESDNPEMEFLRFWTGFEAAVKAEGKGMLIPMEKIRVEKNTYHIEGKIWYVTSLELTENSITSVATDIPEADIEIEKTEF